MLQESRKKGIILACLDYLQCWNLQFDCEIGYVVSAYQFLEVNLILALLLKVQDCGLACLQMSRKLGVIVHFRSNILFLLFYIFLDEIPILYISSTCSLLAILGALLLHCHPGWMLLVRPPKSWPQMVLLLQR